MPSPSDPNRPLGSPDPVPTSQPSVPQARPATLSPTPAFAAREEAERLLTRANIQFRRGLTADAAHAIQELLAQRPQDAGAHELLADIRLAQGDLPGAQDALRAALTAEPGRATAEAKLARVVLQLSERARLQSMGMAYVGSDASLIRLSGGAPRGSGWGAVASAFLPGLGQMIRGEAWKGAGLMAAYFLDLLLLSLSGIPFAGRMRSAQAEAHSGWSWFLLALLVGLWLYAVVDAGRAGHRDPVPPEKDGWQV